MKKILVFFLCMAVFLGRMTPARAQAPYQHGFGATVGTTQAFSYKTFPCTHFAIQLDLGTKYCYVYGSHLWSLELAPNFMYEGHFTAGLYGFAGLGGSIGYNWQPFYYIDNGTRVSRHNGKGGLNGIFGLEYKFNCPMALQFDFRPGYRCVFHRHFADHQFDWGLNFGVRYTL